MVLSAEEKIKMVQFWYETRSLVSVKRSFRRGNGCNPSETPHNNAISRIVHHFRKRGQCMESIRGDPVGHQW